jgi:nicotinamide phosphoribosyltransferase
MFKPTSLFYTDGYKIGHKRMLAPGTTKLYGTWIPRSTKYAPKGVTKILSVGQQLVVRWLHDEFKEHFFDLPKDAATQFGRDMSMYLGMEYDATHFEQLHDLGYLPIRIKSLPEGIETPANVPHMTFINTVDGFAWLTLYLETIISSLAWKPATSATIALQYRRNLTEWVMKTDPANAWLIDFLAHDFSARGLSPWDMLSSGLGHATSFRGSDSIIVIPAARYYYDEPMNEVCINSVNASEHSVSTTCIFTMGESKMIKYFMDQYPTGILSIVSDTFDLWKLITEYLPENKEQIMSRDGKLVIRPDSGNPVDIICGSIVTPIWSGEQYLPESKGVIELLWDIFGGTINEQGYKVLDPHIGAIYGDSITLERQVEIYRRLEAKGFAATNIVLGVGSFTYQMNTRDTLGFAAKGAWFEVEEEYTIPGVDSMLPLMKKVGYDIYKDPVTDDGTKKSLKGLIAVDEQLNVHTQCTPEQEATGILHTIYEDGKFYNQTTLTTIRERISKL